MTFIDDSMKTVKMFFLPVGVMALLAAVACLGVGLTVNTKPQTPAPIKDPTHIAIPQDNFFGNTIVVYGPENTRVSSLGCRIRWDESTDGLLPHDLSTSIYTPPPVTVNGERLVPLLTASGTDRWLSCATANGVPLAVASAGPFGVNAPLAKWVFFFFAVMVGGFGAVCLGLGLAQRKEDRRRRESFHG